MKTIEKYCVFYEKIVKCKKNTTVHGFDTMEEAKKYFDALIAKVDKGHERKDATLIATWKLDDIPCYEYKRKNKGWVIWRGAKHYRYYGTETDPDYEDEIFIYEN